MNSAGLHQNFILFLENKAKDPQQTPNRRLCCEKCRFSTKDAELFERHVAHHEEVTFSCNLCDHVSYSRVESQRHIVKHKGSFPYKCSWCPYGAVRRDYMVKHIQRIHGKTADGSFITDGSLAATKMEHLAQTGIRDLSLGMPRTSGGPLQDVKVVSHSAGLVSDVFPGIAHTRHAAPGLIAKPVQQKTRNQICSTTAQAVTSTSYSPSVTKTLPCIVPNTIHTVGKGALGVPNPPKVMVSEVGQTVVKTIQHIKKLTDKPSLEPLIPLTTNPPPRVHVGICGERTFQQKTLFQSPVGGTTEKTVIQSKTVPKIQVAVPGGSNNHLKTYFTDILESPAAQKPLLSGEPRGIPAAHSVPRSVPSGSIPNNSAERFGQGASSITHRANTPEKPSQQKTRPNVLVLPPSNKLQPSGRSGVQKELAPPVHQPVQHNRTVTLSCPEERYHPGSNVQVELLAPLNQPIQHNKPLTVSCPEEINIPAGCLVELVEVKNVNGTRELELRLVPQQLAGSQQGDLKSSTAAATTDRMSFKCRVAPEDNQMTKTNPGIGCPKTNAFPEPLVKRAELQKPLTNIKVTVKNEPEVIVLCSNKNATQESASSSKSLPGASRSIFSKSAESHKPTQPTCSEQKNAVNGIEPLNPVKQLHFTGKNTCHNARTENVTPKGLKYELRAAQPCLNKDAEGHFKGLPVISSVFSLCPIPQESLKRIQPREGILDKQVGKEQLSSDSGPTESVKNFRVYKLDLKTEDETGLLAEKVKKCGQSNKKDESLAFSLKAPEGKVAEKIDDTPKKTYPAFADSLNRNTTNLCSSTPPALQTDRVSSVIISLSNQNNASTQHKKGEDASPSGDSLPAQRDKSHGLYMNPTVALVRIPSLESIALSDSGKKSPEKADGELSITARPVLCCTSNQQNVQERSIKLVLKRKRSETEDKDGHRDSRLCLAYADVQPAYKKVKKRRKRDKKCTSSKVEQILEKGHLENLVLTPLKEDQLVKIPGPNQPVVVLNHPRPLVKVLRVDVQEYLNPAHDLHRQNGATQCQTEGQVPSFKMKLKKVQGQKYEVTELVLKGLSEKVILGHFSKPVLHHCL